MTQGPSPFHKRLSFALKNKDIGIQSKTPAGFHRNMFSDNLFSSYVSPPTPIALPEIHATVSPTVPLCDIHEHIKRARHETENSCVETEMGSCHSLLIQLQKHVSF